MGIAVHSEVTMSKAPKSLEIPRVVGDELADPCLLKGRDRRYGVMSLIRGK